MTDQKGISKRQKWLWEYSEDEFKSVDESPTKVKEIIEIGAGEKGPPRVIDTDKPTWFDDFVDSLPEDYTEERPPREILKRAFAAGEGPEIVCFIRAVEHWWEKRPHDEVNLLNMRVDSPTFLPKPSGDRIRFRLGIVKWSETDDLARALGLYLGDVMRLRVWFGAMLMYDDKVSENDDEDDPEWLQDIRERRREFRTYVARRLEYLIWIHDTEPGGGV